MTLFEFVGIYDHFVGIFLPNVSILSGLISYYNNKKLVTGTVDK